jgi:hypothetical protein
MPASTIPSDTSGHWKVFTDPSQGASSRRPRSGSRRIFGGWNGSRGYRLATPLPDGRWQVPPDLLSQLEARERTHPQRRLRIEPVAVRERAALGQAVAQQLGLSYVGDPTAFRGRVFACAPTPSGREYVGVADHARRQFTLVPKSPELEHSVGRQVTVSRDRDGRLSISRGPEISR